MRIIIYTRNDCVQCHATRRAMESRGLAFEMVNVDQQPDAADTPARAGFRQLPVVIAGELRWSGFRPDMINRLRPLLYGGQRMSLIVYFSSRSENTHRFVQRLGLPAVRIPLNEREHLRVDRPYILIVPSYGGGGTAGAVPRQAIRFLNDVHNPPADPRSDCRRQSQLWRRLGACRRCHRAKMRRALSLPLRADGNPRRYQHRA